VAPVLLNRGHRHVSRSRSSTGSEEQVQRQEDAPTTASSSFG